MLYYELRKEEEDVLDKFRSITKKKIIGLKVGLHLNFRRTVLEEPCSNKSI